MKYSARIEATGPRVVLSFVAILVVGAALTLILSGEMDAQSPSSDPLPAPELTATAIGGNAVDLSWTAVSGAGRYELWTWSGAWTRLDDGALTDTTYRHNGITAGVTYYYAVRAVATDGTVGVWSEYIGAAEDPTWTPTPTPTATATPTNRDREPSTNPDGTPYQPGTGPTAPGSANSGTGPVPPGGGSPSNPGTVPPLHGGQLPPSHGDGSSPGSGNVPSPSELTPVPTPVPPGHAGVPTATATALLTITPTASPTPTATPTPTWEPTATPTATAPALLAPGMTAMATARGIELSWEAAAGAVRYELATWWDTGAGWQTIGGNNLTGTTLHAHGRYGRDNVLLFDPSGECGGGDEWLAGRVSLCHRACVDGGGDGNADADADADADAHRNYVRAVRAAYP